MSCFHLAKYFTIILGFFGICASFLAASENSPAHSLSVIRSKSSDLKVCAKLVQFYSLENKIPAKRPKNHFFAEERVLEHRRDLSEGSPFFMDHFYVPSGAYGIDFESVPSFSFLRQNDSFLLRYFSFPTGLSPPNLFV